MAITDWLQYSQSIISGLVVSFLLAKLFSLIFSNEQPHDADVIIPQDDDSSKKVIDDDDDWEGVESTELDEKFSEATRFVAARGKGVVTSELKMVMYGLYKIATEGPCCVAQPSAIKITSRAKWNAWHKLGAMPPEEAMQKYIDIITKLFPTWADDSTSNSQKRAGGDSDEPSSKDTSPMGPVFSSFEHEEESGNELKLDAIHDFAREGDMENLLKCVEAGISVDTKDSEGRTPLHWAVDRGHIDVVELLLSRNADVNLKDNEGQTPLHYAAVCERKEIGELLVKRNAGTDIKDNDGKLLNSLQSSEHKL
ncbi:acyl-CoA-binding domain-containing protein 1-like protein, partial [Tanacetum coccineum]